MNLILFDLDELSRPLALTDYRSIHILEILKLKPGDKFLAGLVNKNLGTLKLLEITSQGLIFSDAQFDQTAPKPFNITLLIGTPRPPTARRLLKDLTTMGVQRIIFCATELGEKSYLQSTLWKEDWRRALLEGAMQTKTTLLPEVLRFDSLTQALKHLDQECLEKCSSPLRLAFEAEGQSWPVLTAETGTEKQPLFMALGPERGWTEKEVEQFVRRNWKLVSLGSRILRTETACSWCVAWFQALKKL